MSNPILNTPYEEPKLHYFTNSDGSLNYEEIMEVRRPSSPEVPSVPLADVKSPDLFAIQEVFDYSAFLINRLRIEIKKRHEKGYPSVTRISKELLDFGFSNPERISTHKLFLAQQEPVETAIYINEVASKENFGNFVLTELEKTRTNEIPDSLNRFERIAFKMATGTGKTVILACLILHHILNKQEYRNDTRSAERFLIITIEDRLGVLFVDTDKKGIKRKDFLAKVNTRKKVEHTFRIEINEEALDRQNGYIAHPIEINKKDHKIAVRVISQYGEENKKVYKVG